MHIVPIADPELGRLIDTDTPKLNPDLANGLAIKHMEETDHYVRTLWQAVASAFPEDLQFVDIKRMLPQQHFDEITKKRTRREFDNAYSSLYMVRTILKFKGEEISKPMMLPYVTDGGVLYLSGSRFVISPVLADRVISITAQTIFIRLTKSLLTMFREAHGIMVNGHRETVQIVWSLVYHKEKDSNNPAPKIKAKTSMMHYLFCKYGFTETFKRFTGVVPIVGYPDVINARDYPPDDWVICSSTYVHDPKKPRHYGFAKYQPTHLRVAVPRKDFTQQMKTFIGGFFYVADHFPTKVKLEELDQPLIWRIMLGELLFSSNTNIAQLLSQIDEHMRSLDQYVDKIVEKKLRQIDLPITDIYQMFALIIEKFDEWLQKGKENINSLFGKELSILYYVYEEIMHAINRFYFAILKASGPESQPLTKERVTQMLNKNIKPGAIFGIAKATGWISTTAVAGDNKALRLTAMLVPQSSSTKSPGKKKDASSINDPSKRIHVSVAEFGSYTGLTKPDPAGHSRVNLAANVDPSGMMLRKEEHIELNDQVQAMIRK